MPSLRGWASAGLRGEQFGLYSGDLDHQDAAPSAPYPLGRDRMWGWLDRGPVFGTIAMRTWPSPATLPASAAGLQHAPHSAAWLTLFLLVA